MQSAKYIIVLSLIVVVMSGCSVMSSNMRGQVSSSGSFEELVQNIDNTRGSTVILGGYVVEVANEAAKSTITMVHAPLGLQDEPGSRDKSKGRLIVEYSGFIDPEVYTKDRKVTIGGRIVQGAAHGSDQTPYPFLRIAAAEVYLWPVPKKHYDDHYWWYHPYHRYYWSHWRHPSYRYGTW